MITFDQTKNLILPGLVATPYADVYTYMGPDDPDVPGRFMVITRTGGPGLDTDDLFDNVEIQVKTVGQQNDQIDAETFALLVDQILIRQGNSQTTGDGLKVASIYRSGSAPSPLLVDDADRTHFVCSYIVAVQSAWT